MDYRDMDTLHKAEGLLESVYNVLKTNPVVKDVKSEEFRSRVAILTWTHKILLLQGDK
jgi:hypothetical protein